MAAGNIGSIAGQVRSALQRQAFSAGFLKSLRQFGWAILLAATFGCGTLRGQDADPNSPGDDPLWTFHIQATAIPQGHSDFHSPYQGANSLDPESELKSSVTTTFFIGRKLTEGTEFYLNPELLAGEGLSKTLGLADFPNGEIYRVDTPTPKVNISRCLIRQTWGFGRRSETVDDSENQIRGRESGSRIVLTVGKFSLVDLFDDNRYSHDARSQFMNWALMDNGAWDFAADTRGYTYGLMLSFVRRAWEVHYGLVEVSKRPNGMAMDLRIGRAHSNNLEVEHRHLLHAHPGALRAMAYGNNAHMGSYREALNTPAFHLDLVPTRAYRLKFGFGLNAEQEITRDVGVFFRAGWNDGHTETWEFTEIDRSGSGGVDVSGRPWKRPNDHFGVALVESGLSRDHREFLAAGGMGFIIGDGKLDYGREHVLEAYYAVSLGKGFAVSPDLQWAHNPAYNRDRGPVPMAALRVHWEH